MTAKSNSQDISPMMFPFLSTSSLRECSSRSLTSFDGINDFMLFRRCRPHLNTTKVSIKMQIVKSGRLTETFFRDEQIVDDIYNTLRYRQRNSWVWVQGCGDGPGGDLGFGLKFIIMMWRLLQYYLGARCAIKNKIIVLLSSQVGWQIKDKVPYTIPRVDQTAPRPDTHTGAPKFYNITTVSATTLNGKLDDEIFRHCRMSNIVSIDLLK